MKAMYSAPPEKAWKLGKGPFVFSGVPPACTGNLELINISEQKVKIRSIPVVSRGKNSLSGHISELSLVASLAPRSSARIPAVFQIKPDTPSGMYKTALSCGKQEEEVIVHVFNNYDYNIDPPRVFLRGAAGETISQRLVITNTGNVSFSLPEVSLIWLEEQDWVGRTLVYALRESPKSEGYQDYLDRVMEEFRSKMIPSTRVRIESKPAEIAPGVVAQVVVNLTLPQELKKGKTYVGFVKFPGRRLWFEIECTGAINPEKRRQK